MEAFSSKALLCLDEFEMVFGKNLSAFKSNMTKVTFSIRRPYDKYRSEMPHRGSLCGTTNNQQFITDARWGLTPATTTPTASESATRVVSTRKASLPTLALQPRRNLWKTSSTVSPSTIPSRDSRSSRPPLGSQELSWLRCQGMAEGNRLPSLENAPHQKTDGEFFLCKYPLNAVLHTSKKCCTFARRHHFSNFETRIRNLALHQHKLMEVIP